MKRYSPIHLLWICLFLISQSLPAQQFQMAGQIGGTGYQSVYGIAHDPNGNIYSTGVHSGTTDFDPGPGTANRTSNGSQDGFVCKWSPSGQHKWSFTIGGKFPDQGRAIVYHQGYIYVGGRFRDTVDFDPGILEHKLVATAEDDLFVAKYDTNGQFIWAESLGGPNDEELMDLAVDPLGRIWFCGLFSGPMDFDPGPGSAIHTSTGTQDAFVCAFDPAGMFVFAGTFGSSPGEFANGIDIDPWGNVYVTGQFWGTVDFDPGAGVASRSSSGFNSDLYMFSWDNNGVFRWVQKVGSSGGNEIAYSLDFEDGVATAGGGFQGTADFDPGTGTFSIGSAGNYDLFIWQLDTAGQFVNAAAMGGPDNDQVYSVAIEGNGKVYATGFFSTTSDFDPGTGIQSLTSNGIADVYMLELNPDLSFGSVYQIGGTGSDFGLVLHLDGMGNATAGGFFNYTVDFDPGPATYNLMSVVNTTDGFITTTKYCTPVTDSSHITICPGDSVLVFGTYRHRPGTYRDTFLTAQGCDSVVTVEVAYLTTVSIGSDTTICQGDSVILQVSAGPGVILWSTGDTSEMITVDSPGVYWVAVTQMGCTVFDTVEVVVWPLPSVDLGPDVMVCPGDSIQLFASGSYSAYQWNTGAMEAAIQAGAGIFWLQVTDSNGCIASDTVEVGNFQPFSYAWLDDTAACIGTTLVLRAPSGFVGYQWPDSSTGIFYGATTMAQADSQYAVNLKLTDTNGCVVHDSVQVHLHAPGDLQLLDEVWTCPGDTVTLVAAAGFAQYAWSTGTTGPILTLPTDASTPDTVQIIVTAIDSNGCQSMDSTLILLYPPIPLRLQQDTLVCNGTPVVFEIPRGFSDHLWSTGDTSSTLLILTDTVSQSPWVLFAESHDSNGCRVRDSIVLQTANSIPFDLGRDTAVCKGDTVTFSGPRGYSDYVWSNGVRSSKMEVNTDTISDPVVQYTLMASDSNGCPSQDSIQLIVHTPVVLRLDLDTTICQGQLWTATAPPGYAHYEWSNGDTGRVLQVNTDTMDFGTYYLSLIATDSNGCMVEDSVELVVEDCIGLNPAGQPEFRIHPNPVDQVLYIESTFRKSFYFRLVDVRGRLLQSGIVQGNTSLNVSGLAAGIYILQVGEREVYQTFKVVKVNNMR